MLSFLHSPTLTSIHGHWKNHSLIRWTFVGKVMSLFFNMLSAAAAAKSLQSCPTLCDPMDGSPPGSPRPCDSPGKNTGVGCLSFSNAGKWKVKVKLLSHVWLLATPWTAAHQAPPCLGFSRQEHWSGLPFPSPMHESEKWKWSCSVMFDSSWPPGLQPTRLLHPWDFPGKSTAVGCHFLFHRPRVLQYNWISKVKDF